jgi:hypothetical protein
MFFHQWKGDGALFPLINIQKYNGNSFFTQKKGQTTKNITP